MLEQKLKQKREHQDLLDLELAVKDMMSAWELADLKP